MTHLRVLSTHVVRNMRTKATVTKMSQAAEVDPWIYRDIWSRLASARSFSMGGTYDRVIYMLIHFGKCFRTSPGGGSGFSPRKGKTGAQNAQYHDLNWIPQVIFTVNIRGTSRGGDLTYSFLHLLASEQDRAVVDKRGVQQGYCCHSQLGLLNSVGDYSNFCPLGGRCQWVVTRCISSFDEPFQIRAE